MSSKTKKRLFIALAGLLASSTAAVLVAYPGASDSGPQTSSAQVTGDAGCLASIEGVCEFSALALDEAPFRFDFAGDTPLETYAALSDVIGATHGESAQWRFADELGTSENRLALAGAHLVSDISAQPGGAYNIGPQDHFQPDPSSRYFNSLMSLGGGTSSGGSSPGGSSSGGSPPDGSSPDGDSPDGGSPGGNSPGSNSPEGSSPDGNSPGSNSPDGSSPGGGTPGGDDTIEGPNDPVSVPEPGTMGLLAFGLALAFMGRRRRAPI